MKKNILAALLCLTAGALLFTGCTKKKIENIYKALGYEKTSSLLKRKISKDLKNDVYIEAVMNILKGVEWNSGFVRRKEL